MPTIDSSPEWQALNDHCLVMKSMHLRELLQNSVRSSQLTAGVEGIQLDFSRENVTQETIGLLLQLATAAGVESKIAAMFSGHHVNVTENRAAMHVALRAPNHSCFEIDGTNVVPAVHEVLNQMGEFVGRVRDGQWLGSTGKPLTTVLAIGIGGSYLGPEFVFEALRTDKSASHQAQGRTLRFLANVDPIDVSRALTGLNPENTLVIIISKTFTTAETMLNARTVKNWLLESLKNHSDAHGQAVSGESIIRQHMIAVSTSVAKAVAFGVSAENVFGFWDWVGGRYSLCSAVGVLPLSLHYGNEVVRDFLAGAHAMDNHFHTAPLAENLPVLLGMLGVWNSSFMGHSCRAILPYCQALSRFAAHIQQLDMESNGKGVSRSGEVLPFACGEIIFGEPGTNGQHSFYQLLHQGRVVPAEFIGFCKSPAPVQLAGEPVSSHDELMSNFFAQPDALACGKTLEDLAQEGVEESLRPHKVFTGNRPSLSLLLDELTPFSCGQLLALYEHRVVVQGFVWDINSFDQWGVELGKVLATRVRGALVVARGHSGAEAAAQATSGFNSSTASLLQRYISHSA